jgi:hypothetical protein
MSTIASTTLLFAAPEIAQQFWGVAQTAYPLTAELAALKPLPTLEKLFSLVSDAISVVLASLGLCVQCHGVRARLAGAMLQRAKLHQYSLMDLNALYLIV